MNIGFRFNPHLLVFLVSLAGAMLAGLYSLHAGVWWWNAKTYVQRPYVMDEGRPNDGAPYIAGHYEGTTEQVNILGEMRGGVVVVAGVPNERFEAGKRILVWHSPVAWNTSIQGRWTNDVPVAAMAERPGFLQTFGYAALALAILAAGIKATVWVYQRYAIRAGAGPADGRPGR